MRRRRHPEPGVMPERLRAFHLDDWIDAVDPEPEWWCELTCGHGWHLTAARELWRDLRRRWFARDLVEARRTAPITLDELNAFTEREREIHPDEQQAYLYSFDGCRDLADRELRRRTDAGELRPLLPEEAGNGA